MSGTARSFSFANDERLRLSLHGSRPSGLAGITADLTPAGCVELIERWLDSVKATLADDEEPPITCGPSGPGGDKPEPKDDGGNETEGPQTIPERGRDDDDRRCDDGGDAKVVTTANRATTKAARVTATPKLGTTEGGDDADGDDEGSTDGGDEDGTDTSTAGPMVAGRDGDGNDADTMNRGEAPKGTNDGDGAGGSGQSISEASDPRR